MKAIKKLKAKLTGQVNINKEAKTRTERFKERRELLCKK